MAVSRNGGVQRFVLKDRLDDRQVAAAPMADTGRGEGRVTGGVEGGE